MFKNDWVYKPSARLKTWVFSSAWIIIFLEVVYARKIHL